MGVSAAPRCRGLRSIDAWGIRHAGLFTFAQSAKHVGLYGKFGFHPRFLTAIMAVPIGAQAMNSAAPRYSALPAEQQQEAENACRELTEELYPGLDLGGEIRTVAALRARRHGSGFVGFTSDIEPSRDFRNPQAREL